jgi:hypothetical protein
MNERQPTSAELDARMQAAQVGLMQCGLDLQRHQETLNALNARRTAGETVHPDEDDRLTAELAELFQRQDILRRELMDATESLARIRPLTCEQRELQSLLQQVPSA